MPHFRGFKRALNPVWTRRFFFMAGAVSVCCSCSCCDLLIRGISSWSTISRRTKYQLRIHFCRWPFDGQISCVASKMSVIRHNAVNIHSQLDVPALSLSQAELFNTLKAVVTSDDSNAAAKYLEGDPKLVSQCHSVLPLTLISGSHCFSQSVVSRKRTVRENA